MVKKDFLNFYDNVILKLGRRFEKEYPEFSFCSNLSSLYEEYLNQKTMLRKILLKHTCKKIGEF